MNENNLLLWKNKELVLNYKNVTEYDRHLSYYTVMLEQLKCYYNNKDEDTSSNKSVFNNDNSSIQKIRYKVCAFTITLIWKININQIPCESLSYNFTWDV